MREQSEPRLDDDEGPGSPAIERLRLGLPEHPPPPDLLARCLATLPEPATQRSARRGHPALRFAAAAALLVGVAAWFARPVEADVATQLKAVRNAWTEVPAAHRVARRTAAGATRTEESWFVRGKGRRTEVRSGDERLSVEVDNGRWQFRLDERANLVAAWSSRLSVAPDRRDAGLVVESETFLRWAEEHRGQIRIEREALGGAEARKVVVHWPGPTEGAAVPREETVWFDPESHRPLKQRIDYGDGQVAEMTIDYPAADAVSADLFAFRPPRGAAIEINDPDLGRQVYTPGLPAGDDR